ncbi:hypothetical protein [Bradyrhizobium lablabi]|uniref:hypothetical protein n=1 Tax=Bradyrhizobium lablabi TaxID=722472 RepID=UPI00090B95A1|nr:hypothetical protein [Bradyrhizobium lablabi]SHL47355.1 hypothetical protein SAMN05444321_3013 [Bradyrhizobium lablabi]
MKTHKRDLVDKDFPLLPWNRQKAIMEFVLYGTVGNHEVFYKEMSLAERRFYRALIDAIDAYGPVPDERYREIISIKPGCG